MALIPKVKPKQEKKVVSARLDEEAHTMLQRYAAFLGGATHEYIIGESLKRLFRRDKEFNEWLAKNDLAMPAKQDAGAAATADSEVNDPAGIERSVIQRVLNSKNFLAVLLAMVTGALLYFKMPWPMAASLVPQTWNEYFLRLIALRDPWTYAALKASYHVMLFTTPYIGYSFLLSALYIFALRTTRRINPQPLPPYPRSRNGTGFTLS